MRLDKDAVSLAKRLLNINAVSAIFTLRLMRLDKDAVSLAKRLLNINAVSAIFTFLRFKAVALSMMDCLFTLILVESDIVSICLK